MLRYPFVRDGASGLHPVLRALHKYHIAEHAHEAVDYANAEERSACEAAQRLVSLLCERLCTSWGSSTVVSTANTIRCASFQLFPTRYARAG